MKHMSEATRSSRSFTIDLSILDYLQHTRSSRSRSERVNELLRRAILAEQNEALEKEAAEFFAAGGRTDRTESKAFAAASRRSIARAGD
jgi:replicative DNA helicase